MLWNVARCFSLLESRLLGCVLNAQFIRMPGPTVHDDIEMGMETESWDPSSPVGQEIQKVDQTAAIPRSA